MPVEFPWPSPHPSTEKGGLLWKKESPMSPLFKFVPWVFVCSSGRKERGRGLRAPALSFPRSPQTHLAPISVPTSPPSPTAPLHKPWEDCVPSVTEEATTVRTGSLGVPGRAVLHVFVVTRQAQSSSGRSHILGALHALSVAPSSHGRSGGHRSRDRDLKQRPQLPRVTSCPKPQVCHQTHSLDWAGNSQQVP